MITTEIILFVLLAYITGAFPSAVWVGKTFYKIDVREYGSGNAGATNTFRVLGKKAGVPVLFMDIFKGWLAVNYVHFISNVTDLSPELIFENKLAFGIAAVIGHLFPVYTGFRGGKGIATMMGLLIGLNAWAALFSFGVFVIVFLISKYVSLASIIASIAFPFFVMIVLNSTNESLNLFAIFVPILSLITHQKNIERLIRGEETKVIFDKKIIMMKKTHKHTPKSSSNKVAEKVLFLINDNYNTFDHVIDCLVAICDHDPIQAEQCAVLVHYKGSCEIAIGKTEDLIPLQEDLSLYGLDVEIL
jgi:glycerol-3-phosphate acyltransferase PlsY